MTYTSQGMLRFLSEEINYILKELYDLLSIYRQKLGQYIWNKVLRCWMKGGRINWVGFWRLY